MAATCNSGGAENWQSEISYWFQDRDVVILPDNDEAGRKHARVVARDLNGIAKHIRIVNLPGLPEKGDVTDWLEAGGTFDELMGLMRAAPNWHPTSADEDGLLTVLASEVKMRPVFWLWHNYIPRRKLSISGGMPKQGKSTVALQFAATVSKGGTWPNGEEMYEPADVLIFSSEDDVDDTIVPRLVAMGADLSRIRFVKGVYTIKDGNAVFSIADNLPQLKAHLEKYPQTALIILDPVAAFLGDKVDGWVETKVRRGLSPLRELASDFNVAILGTMHLRRPPKIAPCIRLGEVWDLLRRRERYSPRRKRRTATDFCFSLLAKIHRKMIMVSLIELKKWW